MKFISLSLAILALLVIVSLPLQSNPASASASERSILMLWCVKNVSSGGSKYCIDAGANVVAYGRRWGTLCLNSSCERASVGDDGYNARFDLRSNKIRCGRYVRIKLFYKNNAGKQRVIRGNQRLSCR